MKRWATFAFLVGCGIGVVSAQYPRHAAAQTDTGWVMMFDGESLAGWTAIGNANWRLENGAIVADNGNGFLVSANTYTDFQLRVEFWIEAKTNSGVFIRCTDPNSVSGKTAYEVNIWDTRPEQNKVPARSSTLPPSTPCRTLAASGTSTRSLPKATRSPSS